MYVFPQTHINRDTYTYIYIHAFIYAVSIEET